MRSGFSSVVDSRAVEGFTLGQGCNPGNPLAFVLERDGSLGWLRRWSGGAIVQPVGQTLAVESLGICLAPHLALLLFVQDVDAGVNRFGLDQRKKLVVDRLSGLPLGGWIIGIDSRIRFLSLFPVPFPVPCSKAIFLESSRILANGVELWQLGL